MKTVLIIGRHVGAQGSQHDDIVSRTYNLALDLVRHGYNVVTDELTQRLFGLPMQYAKNPKECDFAIIIGGDGTMVGASRDLASAEHQVKLIGINAGRLGFITDLPKNVAIEALVAMLEGNHKLEERRLLSCLDKLALNDVVFKSTNGRVLDFAITIDGSFAYRCRADGVLITTPTGSTAYSCSANGAILFPTARVLEIVPLLPQTLSHRALVVNDDAVIGICSKNGGTIYIDGIDGGEMISGQVYEVTLAKEVATFCHPVGEYEYDFFKTLREKLHWYLEPGTQP